MTLHLKVQRGPDAGTVFEVQAGKAIMIGRGRDTKTGLTDPKASRHHCKLVNGADSITLEDVGSLGGTRINGERISQVTEVKCGDVVRVGQTELLLQDPDASDPSVHFSTFDFFDFDDPTPPAEEFDELIGKKIHKYEIERPIASGENGKVYFAKDVNDSSSIAIKVLSPSVSQDTHAMQRFVRAMKTMFPVHHPNIVRIHNAGQTGDHTWIAMEFVDGNSATEIVKAATPEASDWRRALSIGIQVARAMEEASKHNIVHRQINPQNVLVRDEDGVAKLGDLMFAKALNPDGPDVSVSRAGEVLEDLTYEAPEATFGIENLNERSDIYSLGAVIFAMITGRPPFEASCQPELIDHLRDDECPPPSSLGVELPDDFEVVLMRMLEKRPEDRFDDSLHMLKALTRIAGEYHVAVPKEESD